MRKPVATLLLLGAITPAALAQSTAEPTGEAAAPKFFVVGEEAPARHALLARHSVRSCLQSIRCSSTQTH